MPDSNIVERAIRPLVLSRKNALFASGDDGGRRWADLASLVETCKLNGVNPKVYLTDLLTRLVNGWPQSRTTSSCHGTGRPQKPAERQAGRERVPRPRYRLTRPAPAVVEAILDGR